MKFSKLGKTGDKQHFQFSFAIPTQLFKPFEALEYQWRKWKYKLNPDHCDMCGKKMFVKLFEVEHVFANGQRLVVGNHAHGKLTCRECLIKELETKEWTPRFTHFHMEREGKPSRYNYRFWSQKQCAITGKKVRSFKDVEIFPYVDMTFCTIAWNHSYISKEAVIECLREGKVRAHTWGFYKKNMHPMNHKRLFIDDEGNLL